MTRACEAGDLELAWELIHGGLANTYADFCCNPRPATSGASDELQQLRIQYKQTRLELIHWGSRLSLASTRLQRLNCHLWIWRIASRLEAISHCIQVALIWRIASRLESHAHRTELQQEIREAHRR
eukprot:16061417-Heterocapsa_arctica.AAC.1